MHILFSERSCTKSYLPANPVYIPSLLYITAGASMSGNSDRDVDIEMPVMKGPDDHPTKRAAGGPSFKDRFGRILTDYDDERTWWVAVKDLQDKDVDFATNVSSTSAFLHAWRILPCRSAPGLSMYRGVL